MNKKISEYARIIIKFKIRVIMWPKAYKDYEKDCPLIKYQVESGHGIIGCEMHDLNGWGTTLHIPWTPQGEFPQIKKRKDS